MLCLVLVCAASLIVARQSSIDFYKQVPFDREVEIALGS